MRLLQESVRLFLALWLALTPGFAFAGSMTLLGVGKPAAAGGGCTEATTLIARMDGSQSNSDMTTAVCGMVTDGTYALLDFLYVFTASSATNAKLNWKSTSFSPAVTNGTCTFNLNDNINGDGSTCFITTGYTPSTAGGNATLNSATAGVCETLSYTSGNVGIMMASNDGTNNTIVAPTQGGGGGLTGIYDINDATFATSTSTDMQGSWILTRNASNQTNLYRNGSLDASSPMSSTSAALVTKPLYIMARNLNGTADQFSFARIGYAFYAGGMTATQVANIRSRLNTYLTALRGSGPC